MFQKLQNYVRAAEDDISDISAIRKEKLTGIADFIEAKKESGEPAKLIFICTHNSRRSHFCRIWLAVLADHFGLDHIESFSGGTEATAFNPRAVEAIKRVGFKVKNPGGENPRYEIYYDDNKKPLICFSKTFDDPVNPQKNFAAIMTCTEADQNCPHVPGAIKRISIPYADPKKADNSPQETDTYDRRCHQIATEMLYMVSQIKPTTI